MPKYFNKFPTTFYNLTDNNTGVDVVTNITSKFSFEESFKNNTSVYYSYVISDGDSPEIVAHKIYGDAEKHWIILAMNDLYDVVADWPMDQPSWVNYMNKKYYDQADTSNTGISGTQWAQTHVHSFYKFIEQTIISTDKKHQTTIQIDENTYANTTETSTIYTLNDNSKVKIDVLKGLKTYYYYENELNESKRNIKIMKPEFVPQVEAEFKRVISL